ncbi:MAG: arylsulfatase [Candidatus Hydrogenedentota bacterium]
MNRREFMQMAAGGVASIPFAGATGRAVAAQGGKRPNFVIIMADDMGFSDIGCYGSEIATPNLDGLAREGLRFTHGYSAARCCPSRAALLTGLYPHLAGMGGMVTRRNTEIKEGPYQGFLNNRCVTLAEALRGAGYRTYMSGKWHVGERPEHWPRQRGFDRYFGLISGASSYWEILDEEANTRTMALDDEPYTPVKGEYYMTDAFTDHAVDFLREHGQSENPFLLYLAYTAPHWPLHAWPEDIARYKDRYKAGWDELRNERHARQIDMKVVDPKWPLAPRDPEVPAWDDAENKEQWSQLMAIYAAMIDRMDQGIGKVLQTLKDTGADDNTIVMFVSDNGGCHETLEGRELNVEGSTPGLPGSFLAYRRPWANASNTPFRMFKHWVHEGGIATPWIVRWPAGMEARGELSGQVVHITDIMPTCLDAAGVEYPKEFKGQATTPLTGKSLLPIFKDGVREPHDTLYWEHLGNRAVRHGDWKLVAVKEGDWELYNLKDDRTELKNLGGEHPAIAVDLMNRYSNWAEATGIA